MKQIMELDQNTKDSPVLKKLAMDIMQHLFSESQQNLVQVMPWGDDQHSGNGRKPTVITNESILLLSGIPPYWENDHTIIFRYDAPHAKWVEYGTPPHAVSASRLVGWVNKKLQVKGKDGLVLAYKVANKIRTKGIEPHPYIRPAIEATVKYFNLTRQGE